MNIKIGSHIIEIDNNLMFKLVIVIWVFLWALFLVREDKDGQYKLLREVIFNHGRNRASLVYGEDFYNAVKSASVNIPKNTTFAVAGLEKYSIDEVRARYMLWPVKYDPVSPDYYISSGDIKPELAGRYVKIMNLGKKWFLFRKGR